MFIPPKKLAAAISASQKAPGKVRLQNQHLLIDRTVAVAAFPRQDNVYLAYYPEKRSLLVAAADDEIFKNLHKGSQYMLKGRNNEGDKSIALHELLIDHQIDDRNRELTYELQAGLGILHIQL